MQDSIRALLRMQSPSNVAANPSRYNQRLADEDYAFADDLLPEDDSLDLKDAQTDAFARSGGTYAPSREALRESALNPLRQQLGMTRRTHEQALERDIARENIAAARADRSNRYILDRQERTQRATDDRQQRQFDQSLALQERLFGQQNRAREDTQAAQVDARATPRATQRAVPAGVYSALTKAEQNMPSGMFAPLTRLFSGDSAQRELNSAVENYLSAKGTLGFLNEIVSDIQAGRATLEDVDTSQLEPREQQYLQRRLAGR